MEFPRKRFAGGSLQEPASSYHHAYRALQQWWNVGTASRELRRNRAPMYHIPAYSPHTAQKKSLPRPSSRHRGLSIHKNFRNPLKKSFRQSAAGTDCLYALLSKAAQPAYSLPAAFQRLSAERQSEGFAAPREQRDLRRIQQGKIHQKAGHWEADTAVSGQSKSEAALSPTARVKDQILHRQQDSGLWLGPWKALLCLAKGRQREFQWPSSRVLFQGQESFPCQSCPLKRDPALLTPGLVRYCLRKKPLCGFFARYGCAIP